MYRVLAVICTEFQLCFLGFFEIVKLQIAYLSACCRIRCGSHVVVVALAGSHVVALWSRNVECVSSPVVLLGDPSRAIWSTFVPFGCLRIQFMSR